MEKIKFFFFIDESGDHSLRSFDPFFPIFNLCGILLSEDNHQILDDGIKKIKTKFWGSEEVIFHSREIRKKEKEFTILSESEIFNDFLNELNDFFQVSKFRIISSVIHKPKYIERYGELTEDLYERCFMFLIERVVFCLDELIGVENKSLEIIVEKRGKREDKKLKSFFYHLLEQGTGFLLPKRLNEIEIKIKFRDKKENDNGLQVSDLIAYPISRYVINPKDKNLPFENFKQKIYQKNGRRFGLKVFP